MTLVQSTEFIQILPIIQACVCGFMQFYHMCSFMFKKKKMLNCTITIKHSFITTPASHS